MADFYENKQVTEEVILVGVALGETSVTDESLDELEELAKTAGAVTVGRLIQNREMIHPGTYLGKGKLEELAFLISETHATGIICDDELSPAQMANMEDVLDIKVMDRTLLILDIFAQRATTREGKIQVELAQLRYRATRLVGMRNSLSRLGGGIGTRGPGEVARQQRQRNQIPVAAIVGYTNAGKSTLLNRLTGAGVLEEDKLFATLDPTTRNLTLDDGQELLLTDTVGFIHKLPHHLVDAFRSTLEEAKYADILIHMVDASNPQAEMHMHVVYETLAALDIKDKKIITVFNKTDLIRDQDSLVSLKDFRADYTVTASVKQGTGLDALLSTVQTILRANKLLIERVFDYAHAGEIAVIRKYGQLLEERYQEDGIYVKAYIPKDIYARLSF